MNLRVVFVVVSDMVVVCVVAVVVVRLGDVDAGEVFESAVVVVGPVVGAVNGVVAVEVKDVVGCFVVGECRVVVDCGVVVESAVVVVCVVVECAVVDSVVVINCGVVVC